MDKTAIKNYSIWARNRLIQEVSDKATLVGVTSEGIKDPLPSSTQDIQFFDYGGKTPFSLDCEGIEQRTELIEAIREKEKRSDYKTAYETIVEEVAYTWFNRLIAIRFMEVNDYLPSGIRIFSGTNGKNEPEIVTKPFETGIIFSETERDKILTLKSENKQDVLFRLLFIKQCNELNKILPGLFEKTNDYTELLLDFTFTDKNGVVSHLINDVEEEDFKEAVEIVGWMYQYYNTEPKDEAFELLQKKNIKITKEKIPAVTQLFTPDWIVRYMVENSLGRLWLEGHPNDELRKKWKYYLDEAEQTPGVTEQLKSIRVEKKGLDPLSITFIDPCMGSGHILVYAFEVLMQIYESVGYMQNEAARSILDRNLYGLDIDKRAYQLAYFALMMCARKYDKKFFDLQLSPQVYHPQGDMNGERYGSLIKIQESMLNSMPKNDAEDITAYAEYENDLRIWNFKRLLSLKYDVVCTNPPYMGSSNMDLKMLEFVKKNYPDSKSDLFATFIERCNEFLKPTGYQAMITQHVWMFLSSYEKLREKLVCRDIINMIHLGARAFEEINGEVVQTTAFVISKQNIEDFKAIYIRLVNYDSQRTKEEAFLLGTNRYVSEKKNFKIIPGSPMAYWVTESILKTFNDGIPLSSIFKPAQGMATGDNNKFVRQWYEVSSSDSYLNSGSREESIEANKKFVPYNKGGTFRKWYGNNDCIIYFKDFGKDIAASSESRFQNSQQYLCQSITWSKISTGPIAFRYKPCGHVFDVAGCSIFTPDEDKLKYLLGLNNSIVVSNILQTISPTMNYEVGQVANLPFIYDMSQKDVINNLVEDNVILSRADWDAFETSWDFKKHPLLNGSTNVAEAFVKWEYDAVKRFNLLKTNEETLNRIFIDIYGLKGELISKVNEEDVTVRRASLGREIRSLISYAIGCMFGRYSLDIDGLIYAGGEWNHSRYVNFNPDEDNIIPITDEEYFKDDVVTRFVEFIRTVYGDDTLEENLDFIAKALEIRGNTSREVIRNYFLKEFFKDHLKIYQKRPIYWLFDSGKENGFKALIYLHRYNPDIIGKLRVDYLHCLQTLYENSKMRDEQVINTSNNVKDINDARKHKDKLIKQINEIKEYDEKIGHLAVSRIVLALDDGVKINYEKLQTVDGKKYEILGKI